MTLSSSRKTLTAECTPSSCASNGSTYDAFVPIK